MWIGVCRALRRRVVRVMKKELFLRERPQSGNKFDMLAKQEGQCGIPMWGEPQGQTVVRNVVREEVGNQVKMEGFISQKFRFYS